MGPVGLLAVLSIVLFTGCARLQTLPEGLSYQGQAQEVGKLSFYRDLTYFDASGQRHTDQEIFDRWLEIIAGARRFILVDMFLFNDFQGPEPEETRGLTRELTEALIDRKKTDPDMRIIVITDPVNTVYGGVRVRHFDRLEAAGVEIHITDLNKLPDSNPSWSMFWRMFVKPFGNSAGGWIRSPFAHDRVTLRSYLSFLNFKANHRKLLVADEGDRMVAMVTGANVHDASSAHSNVALEVDGPVVHDLLQTESAILALSGARPLDLPDRALFSPGARVPATTVQVVTEGKVRDDILATVRSLEAGDRLDVAMFYLSQRKIVRALQAAAVRGVAVRIVLDPNRVAFGIKRGGIPNVAVANGLFAAGVSVRWCNPGGEQCHSKVLMARKRDGSAWMSIGSTNLTRRNLDNFNLETNIVVRGPENTALFIRAGAWFDRIWNNEPDRIYSVEFERYARRSLLQAVIYRFMEGSGWSTF